MRGAVGVCYEKNEKGGYTFFRYDGNEKRFQSMLNDGYVKTEHYKEVDVYENKELLK